MIAPSRRVVLSAAALSAAATLIGGPAVAAPRVRMSLPAPTGPYPVGTVALRLVDRGRRDPWGGVRPYRELMVGVRYPARSVRGYERAPQMTRAAADAYGQVSGLDVPPGTVDWAVTRSHAYTHAPATGRRLPVVLYSPGAGDPAPSAPPSATSSPRAAMSS